MKKRSKEACDFGTRLPNGQRVGSSRPAGFWKKQQQRLRKSDLPMIAYLEKRKKGMLIPGWGWVPSA